MRYLHKNNQCLFTEELKNVRVFLSLAGANTAISEMGTAGWSALRVLAVPAATVEPQAGTEPTVYVVVEDQVLIAMNNLVHALVGLGEAWEQYASDDLSTTTRHPINDVEMSYPFEHSLEETIHFAMRWRDNVQAVVVSTDLKGVN